ncbi:MAG: transglycosylase SLT domain-containing protein [Hyphomonadaceae bacterium]|nr:transglycosylase SLT domain-containing protein [Hyphomonadaceae bacterium]
MAIDRVSMPPAVRVALERAAAETGVGFDLLAETARRESSFNPTARAPTSSATGLFQFVERTWLDMVRRYGAEHGLADAARQIDVSGRVADPAARKAILNLRTDPDIAARMAGELVRENAAALESRLGRAPTAGEVYAAHVLGAAGAGRLIEAAARGASDASALFPREAAANPWLFREKGAPRSAQALLDRLDVAAVDVAGAVEASRPRTMIARADGPALAALLDAMFQALSRDILTPDLHADADPLRAARAYARVGAGDP